MADQYNAVFNISVRLNDSRSAEQEFKRTANNLERELKQIANASEKSARDSERTLKASAKAIADFQIREARRAANETINELGRIRRERMQAEREFSQLGSRAQSIGTSLSALITLPLAAVAAVAVKSALEVDAARVKITALVGSTEGANKKIAELRALARESVGVLQATALDTYAQFKGIGGVTDEVINKIIKSMGKLNAAFTIANVPQFQRNLVQIFTQSFERQDIKQALAMYLSSSN